MIHTGHPGSRRLIRTHGFQHIILAASVATLACATPSAPSVREHQSRLLVAGTEDGTVVLDLDWRGVVRRSGPMFASQGPSVYSAQGEVISVGDLASGDRIMVGVDAASGLELWRVPIEVSGQAQSVDGIELGADVIAAHPARSEVFLWPVRRNDEVGVASFDYRGGRVTRFYGPIPGRFRGMAVALFAGTSDGCLIIGADSGRRGNSRAFLMTACAGDASVREPVLLPQTSHFIRQMELAPGGTAVVVMTEVELLRFDIATMTLTERASRPLSAPFHQSRMTGELIIADAGTEVVSSSGIVFVLGADLELKAVYDLRSLPTSERPLGVLGAEASADGRWLYVLGGVPRGGPLYGPQETHVVVVDRATGQVAGVMGLGTFGGTLPVLIP